MPLPPTWRRSLRLWRPDVAADVDAELRFHFEAREAELRAVGHSPEEARMTAQREFGDVEATRSQLHAIDARVERRRERAAWLRSVLHDLGYTLRGLRHAPGFTASVVLAIAVGVGAATASYGVMRRLLIAPPPHVAAPDRVATLSFHYTRENDSTRTSGVSSYPFYEQLRDHATTLAAVAAYDPNAETIVGRGEDARRMQATLVSAGFWRTLGTTPALGRFFADAEAHPATGARVVVLSHALWRGRFGGDPGVIGQTLTVKGLPYTIVGVAPRGFRGVELTTTDLWLPLFATADGERAPATWHTFASSFNLRIVTRLRTGVTPTRSMIEIDREHHALLDAENARSPRRGRAPRRVQSSVSFAPLTGALNVDGGRRPEGTVAIWLTAVSLVLLAIACANVASLLLLRALRRQREIAVRVALGVSRRRLAALLLVESATLAAFGGLAAAVLVAFGAPALERLLLPGLTNEGAGIDWTTVAAATAAVVVTALVTGVAPIVQARSTTNDALRSGAQHGGTRRSRTYTALLVTQTTLSALLLVGAGLFLRSLHRVTTADIGLEPDRAFVVRLDFTGSGRSGREVVAIYERALDRVRALPGVASAALAMSQPFGSARGVTVRTSPTSEPLGATTGVPFGNDVSDGFFEASGMRMIAGRTFTAADRGGEPVAVVNETLARTGWPGRLPIGECLYRRMENAVCVRIVGVVRDAHTWMIREAEPLSWVYAPLDPTDVDDRVLLVRAGARVRALDGTIARALRTLDPALPYVSVRPLSDALDPQIRPWRLGASVFTAFGALAILLAVLGLYTAVAYAVTQRTREIGVRTALGARASAVLRLVLADGLRVAAFGTLLGIALALAAGPWIAELLFDTSPRDPLVLAAVAAALVAASTGAVLLPARRAARVSPTEALRAD